MKKLYIFLIGPLVVLLTPPVLAQAFKSQAEATASKNAAFQRSDQIAAESRAKRAAKHQEFKELHAEADAKHRAQIEQAKQRQASASTDSPTAQKNINAATQLRGTTDYDISAVEADRTRKAERLAQAKSIAPKDGECIIRPVMSDADIKRCR